MKKIYAGMAADIIHHGHINLIKKARSFGYLIIGILSDEAVKSYKREPIYNFMQRKMIFENIKGVDKVVKQNTLSYKKNLMRYKPNYVIHGDDWKKGVQTNIRQEVIDCLNIWGGKLIEIKYTKNISTTSIINRILKCFIFIFSNLPF